MFWSFKWQFPKTESSHCSSGYSTASHPLANEQLFIRGLAVINIKSYYDFCNPFEGNRLVNRLQHLGLLHLIASFEGEICFAVAIGCLARFSMSSCRNKSSPKVTLWTCRWCIVWLLHILVNALVRSLPLYAVPLELPLPFQGPYSHLLTFAGAIVANSLVENLSMITFVIAPFLP